MKLKSIVVLMAASYAIAQPLRYTVTDLGVVGGAPGQPFNITSNGLISGGAVSSDGSMHAVFWYEGFKGDFGPSALGGRNAIAFGINSAAQAVGAAETSVLDPNGEDFCGFQVSGFPTKGTTCQPFLWQFGKTTALPTLGGGSGAANSINSSRQIVGMAENTTPDPACAAPQVLQFKPVIWQNGQIQELPTAAGDQEGVVLAINENGQSVGASGGCGPFSPQTLIGLLPYHAILWENGQATDLGNLGGTGHGSGNIALNLNNLGQVVGNSDLPGDTINHAFLWSKEKGMQDLGTLPGDVISAAININDLGAVVGVSLDADFNIRPFLWRNGVITDLTTLVPVDSPLALLLACSINARGQIIGVAIDTNTGEFHGYLANPTNNLAASTAAAPAPDAAKRVVLSQDQRRLLQRLRFGHFGGTLVAPR